jgi:opacity protein-like surface antigen
MKRILIAAATAAALATSALAGVAPANAAGTTTAGLIEVGGQWNGGGKWNNGHGHWNGGKWNNGHSKWHGQPRWKAKRSCDPIVRWRMVGPPWHKRWDRVIVGYDCDWQRKHW